MDAKQFERLVALGLGKAVLHLRDHDARPYREIIVDACLHNKAYAPQIEGSRAEYMLDLVQSSGDPAFYAEATIRSLGEEADDWDDAQRFRIARLLAQSGNQSARRVMRAAFQAKRISASDIAAEFIELDGIQGLLFVARQIGEQLAQSPDQWEDDYLLSRAGDICGRDRVDATLKINSETDKNIETYLSAIEDNRRLRAVNQRIDPRALTYGEVRSLIETDKAGGILVQWSKHANDSELICAARDLVRESDPKKLKAYLLLFRKRRFPLEIDHLLRLVELPDGPVPRHTLGVLANLDHEQIRSLAFKLIRTASSLRGYAINLLVKNFRKGDHATVEAWCDAEQDPDVVNGFDRSMREFFVAHPNSEIERRLLIKFYEKEPCAHCRSYVVERLLQLDGLPDMVRRECEHDSYLETRELVRPRIS